MNSVFGAYGAKAVKGRVTLEVMENNAPARALYARDGFLPYALDANTSQLLLLQKKL